MMKVRVVIAERRILRNDQRDVLASQTGQA
jgi:hypothetical protein